MRILKILYIDGKEAKVVNIIFEMYSYGDSFTTIKARLNNAGILTRENKAWDSSAIRRIINNHVYIGNYTWNKRKRSSSITKDPSEWINVEASYTPIVSLDLYDKVQKVIKSKSSICGKGVKSIYLLSSMIKCGHCGHNMIDEKKKHPSGKTYVRYVCGNYLNHKLCFYNFVHKEAIEKLVFDEIREIVKTVKVDDGKLVLVQANTSNAELDI